MGGPRGEEGEGTVEAFGGAEGGLGLRGAVLGGSSEFAFNPEAVLFFFTVSHCSYN